MLFPLSSFVLPQGKMRLRIFEPRYQRLVSQAMQAEGTFGICLLDKNSSSAQGELSQFGTLVKIVDFEQLEDGLLGVTVVGLSKFAIKNVRSEYDGLRFAQVESIANWEAMHLSSDLKLLSGYLEEVYQQFPDISTLYPQKYFDDATWVTQRWLEILPLSKQQFDQLISRRDCHYGLHFLQQALKSE